MKTSSAAVGLALAALAFVLGLWVGGRPPHVDGADPPARLATILRLTDHNVRARALGDFFARANPNDADDLLEVLRGDREHVDEVAEVLYAAWWAQFDAQGALEGRMLPNWSGRYPWIRTVVQEWTRRVPEHALKAVAEMDKKQVEPNQVAVTALIRAWFENDASDPTPLIDIIAALDLVKARGDAINVFLESMMDARGVPATALFVETMAERGYRFKTEFFGRFAGSNTRRDPAYAYAWAQKHADGPHGKNLLRHLSARWGYEDGPAAMEWAVALPPSEQKSFLIERTWRSFLVRDRAGARAWMSDQTPTPELESAWTLYLIGTAKEDPEQAIALAAQVQNRARRDKVLTAAGRAWMRSDRAAAEAWLEGADLTPDVREAILKPRRRLAQRSTPPSED